MKIKHSIIEIIADTAARRGESPALFVNGTLHTYDDLLAAANGIQQSLLAPDFSKEKLVGIITADDFHTYASLLAIMSAGMAYVPINRMNPPARSRAVVEQARLNLVLSSVATLQSETATALADSVQIMNTCDIAPVTGPLHVADISADQTAYLLFTSGSTGVPKGVPIKHCHLNSFMQSVTFECGYNFSESDRFLQMFELTFDLSVMSTFVPWIVGACCYVVPERGISYLNIIDLLDKHRITVALMVPSALAYMQRFFDEISFPDMRISLFCGEALDHDLVAAWSKTIPNARIENVYGPTEATVFCTRYPWIEGESREQSVNGIVPIGVAMPNLRTYVVDNSDNLCDSGEKGELCLAGDQVMDRYWRDQEKTKDAFVPDATDSVPERAYRTGDIVFINQYGNIIYSGRLDSQVKIDGHRIELAEIEHFARKFIRHSMVAAIVSNDETGRPVIDLYIQNGDYAIEDLKAFLASELPTYMQPRNICLLDKMPLNLNGKIDRKQFISVP